MNKYKALRQMDAYALGSENRICLIALKNLLIRKGIITEEELIILHEQIKQEVNRQRSELAAAAYDKELNDLFDLHEGG